MGQEPNGVHATGQPDTPVECLVDVLERALKAGDAESMRSLVEHAYKLASGLDPYLDAISTPPSQVSSCVSFQLSSYEGAVCHCGLGPLQCLVKFDAELSYV